MISRTQKRREKRQEKIEKVQLFYYVFSIVATGIATIVLILKMLCSPTLILLKIISKKGMQRKWKINVHEVAPQVVE